MGARGGSRAIRGLAEGRNLLEQPSAPPGIDLTRPSTPTDDLTQYIRYGSALTFQHLADGWVTCTFLQAAIGAGFSAVDRLWDTQVSGDFGISQAALENMMLWIYNVTLGANVVTQLADIGVSRVTIAIEAGIGDVATGSTQHMIFLNNGTGVDVGPTTRMLPNQALNLRFPVPWPAGAVMSTRFENLANNIDWRPTFLCRVLPFGVPPLP